MLDRLTLDQLRTLMAVAETGSFSAAGRKLRRVQSAVSQTVQALEDTLGVVLFDRTAKTPRLTDAGRVILEDAKYLVGGAARLRARAESIAGDVEPELTLAVDAIFPNDILMLSLKALAETFPHLPVTVFTEGLGGAEQRLLDGAARIALFTPRMQRAAELADQFLANVEMAPVAATHHPLAAIKGPIGRNTLEDQVQLVLTDRTQITAGFSGGVISRRIWRFADLATRLEYLLAGFGWCNMPLHMVEPHIKAGRLKRLRLQEHDSWSLPIHMIHQRNHPPGRAGRWLMEDLRKRLGACPPEGSVKGKRG
jgi:DNA-binding transcriptional LysR family regulator